MLRVLPVSETRPLVAAVAGPFADDSAKDVARRWDCQQHGDGGRGRVRGRDRDHVRGDVRGGRRDRPATEWQRTKPEMENYGVTVTFSQTAFPSISRRQKDNSIK